MKLSVFIIILIFVSASLALAQNPKDELKGVKRDIKVQKQLITKTRKVEAVISTELQEINRNLELKKVDLGRLDNDRHHENCHQKGETIPVHGTLSQFLHNQLTTHTIKSPNLDRSAEWQNGMCNTIRSAERNVSKRKTGRPLILGSEYGCCQSSTSRNPATPRGTRQTNAYGT